MADKPREIAAIFLVACWGGSLYHYLTGRLPTDWSIRWLPGVVCIASWLVIGGCASTVSWKQTQFPVSIEGQKACFSKANPLPVMVELLDDPVEKPHSFQVKGRILKTTQPEWIGKVLLFYFPLSGEAGCRQMGDYVYLSVVPRMLTPAKPGSSFDYAQWLRRHGVCGTAYAGNSWRWVGSASGWNGKRWASHIRKQSIRMLDESGLEANRLALVAAMSLGDRRKLDVQAQKEFAITGTSHILAVSGYHVAVLYALLQGLFFFLRYSSVGRSIQPWLMILCLWIYAFLTGLTPSVNRATVMFTVAILGKGLRRSTQSVNLVFFSAFLLLLMNPLMIYDLGFQLSYVAVAGIIGLYPEWKAIWHPAHLWVKKSWEMICLSVTAQLVTAPITLHTFGQFPTYFLVGNLLLVPLSGFLIYLSAAFFLACPFKDIASFIAIVLDRFAGGFLEIVHQLSALPFALTENIHWNSWLVFFSYLFLVAFTLLVRKIRSADSKRFFLK